MTGKNLLPQDGEVFLFENFITPQIANEWYDHLLSEIDWQQYEIKLFGKKINQPRLSAWYAKPGTAYSYSGLKLQPKPFSKTLTEIKKRVELISGSRFNSILLNLYRHENDSMGLHSDNEKELGLCPVIASLTLGSTRTFIFQHKLIKGLRIKQHLTHGSLLIMKGTTQQYWHHELPKVKENSLPRINLTFRKIVF